MEICYFTDDAFDLLLDQLESNKDYYSNNDDWIKSYFEDMNIDYFKKSTLTLPMLNLNYITEELQKINNANISKSERDTQINILDIQGVQQVYTAFGKEILTPYRATNKYFWTYLSHVVYKDYVHIRWMNNPQDGTIKKRYFVTNEKRSLTYNALSRLWWYGFLTHDPENTSDPFALTKIMLTNQTICTDFIGTKNHMNRTRAVGVLSALKEYSEEIRNSTAGLSKDYRECNKYLNRYGASTNMDFLSSDEIKKITLDFLISYYHQHNKDADLNEDIIDFEE